MGFGRRRVEQNMLRKYLLKNKPHMCIFCNKTFPTCILETAHIKPRHLLKPSERIDKNVVELMCATCHKLYDYGLIAVRRGYTVKCSGEIEKYDEIKLRENILDIYNKNNRHYFTYHYYNVFLENKVKCNFLRI